MQSPVSASGSPPAHVTLMAPGLFALPGAESPVTTTIAALRRLLARADSVPLIPSGLEARQFALFGVRAEPGRDLPVAAVTRIADMGIVDNDWWIRADPVYLEARRDGLVLHAGLELTATEAGQLVSELNESLAPDGWLLRAPRPDRWYLKPPAAAAITTTPLAEARGHDIHPLLPQGPDYKAWHTRLNELQILLHTSSTNAAREAQGKLPANSVWFWGGGRLPRLDGSGWSKVWAADPLTLGLARLAGIPARHPPLGAEADGWQAAGRTLVVLGDLRGETGAIQQVSRIWLEPLLRMIHHGQLASLTLLSDHGPEFRYLRRHRWRLWRRDRPLPAWRAVA